MISSSKTFTRRDFLAQSTLGAIAVAVAATIPWQAKAGAMALHGIVHTPAAEADRLLRAFVEAVLPGVNSNTPHAIAAFTDRAFPFRKVKHLFLWRLRRTTEKAGYKKDFDQLSLEERTRVIESGLACGKVTKKLFHGAVFLSQVTHYCGIYTPAEGAPFIRLDGPLKPGMLKSQWHDSELESVPMREVTRDGNYS